MYATIQQVDLLKGYYKKSKPQLLALLREVVTQNLHLGIIPRQSDSESDAKSSSIISNMHISPPLAYFDAVHQRSVFKHQKRGTVFRPICVQKCF